MRTNSRCEIFGEWVPITVRLCRDNVQRPMGSEALGSHPTNRTAPIPTTPSRANSDGTGS